MGDIFGCAVMFVVGLVIGYVISVAIVRLRSC